MKHYGIALAISFAIGAAIFGVVYPILGNAHIAEGLAAVPVAGCHHIAEMLERREALKHTLSGTQTAVYNMDEFGLKWPLMVAYGTLITFAGVQFASGFGGLLAIALFSEEEATSQQLLVLIGIPSLLGECMAGFFVGRWIGARCARRGILAVILTAGIAAVLLRLGDLLLMSTSDFRSLFGKEPDLPLFLYQFTFIFMILLITALLGYWRGRKRRFSKYLHYLLGVLPGSTRTVLVGLAFEEAQKVRSSSAVRGPMPS